LGKETKEDFGSRAVTPAVKTGIGVEKRKPPAEEEIGELDKIGEESKKPTKPGTIINGRLAMLEEKISDNDGEGEVEKEFLEESGLFGFFLFS